MIIGIDIDDTVAKTNSVKNRATALKSLENILRIVHF